MKSIIITTIGFLLFSCSPSALVIRQMTPVLEKSAEALYEETDLQIAEQAMASNLKLIEGLLKNDPENEELLILVAQGYAGYALAFAEDENPERAKKLYLRARNYAMQVLYSDPGFKLAEQKNLLDLEKHLNSYNKDKVPALFWAGFAWAGYANLALDDPEALLALPEIQLLMQRVEALQSDYFYGAVYLFWGGLYGMKPVMLGGDLKKAHDYFNKNFELNNNGFLLAHIYAARFYAAKVLDEALFDKYLEHVLKTPVDIYPGLQLLNQIAKQKAKRLLAQKEDLF